MSNDQDSLGGRLPLLGKSELSGAQSTLYEAMNKDMVPWARKSGFKAITADGRLLGPFNPLLYSPMIGQGFMEYLGPSARWRPSFTPRRRRPSDGRGSWT